MVEANSAQFFIDAKTLRHFFHVEYSENLGDIFVQFYSNFGQYVPENASIELQPIIKEKILQTLCVRDGDSTDARFCYDVRRNGVDPRTGKQKHRTIFNSDRARLCKEDLFVSFKNDDTLSFYFSEDLHMERTTEDIIQAFAARHGG